MGACCAPQNRAAADSGEADVAVYASSKTPEDKVLDDSKGTEAIAEPEGADPYKGLPIGIALDGNALQVHMQGAPKPSCEEERLATVKVLGDLEYPESSELASILKVIRNIFKSPLAMISLFGDNRIFAFQTDGFFERGDTPPRFMFCSWQMATPNAQVLVVEDTTKDARFADNPIVAGGPQVRAYMGAPLVASNGHRLGSLCIMDTQPREMEAGQAMILSNLAEMVVRKIELDIHHQLHAPSAAPFTRVYGQMQRSMDCFAQCVVLLDTSVPGWRILYANAAWDKVTGSDAKADVGRTMGDMMEQHAGEGTGCLPSPNHQAAANNLQDIDIEGVSMKPTLLTCVPTNGNSQGSRLIGALGVVQKLALRLRPASCAGVDEHAMSIGCPAFIINNKAEAAKHAAKHLYIMLVKPMESSSTASQRARFLGSRPSSFSHPALVSKGRVHEEPLFDGLEMGTLLGRGAHGSVFAGSWNGKQVAVKIIDQEVKALAVCGLSAEAVLGAQLRHPNVMVTLKFAVRTISARPSSPTPSSGMRSTASRSGPAGATITPSTSRTPAPPSRLHHTTLSEAPVYAPASATGPSRPAAAPPQAGSAPPDTQDAMLSQHPSCVGAAPGGGAVATCPDDIALTEGCPVASPPSGGVDGSSNGWERTAQGQGDKEAQDPGACPTWNSAGYPMSGSTLASEMGFGSGVASSKRNSVDEEAADKKTAAGMVQTWILLEFADRGCLQDAAERGWLRDVTSSVRGKPNMAAILATAYEIASALSYLHAHDVVHGDLSAWNVLLSSVGAGVDPSDKRGFVVKVADFGLARSLDVEQHVKTRNYGTLTHQPPETLSHGLVSRETDTYSLGVLMWQMYTGSRPWAGMTQSQIKGSVTSGSTQLKWPPHTPPDFLALASACLSFKPNDRPSMSHVCSTLGALRNKHQLATP